MNKKIPFVTLEQMQLIDQMMVHIYHIGLIQMMENAGLRLAEFTRQLMSGSVEGKQILIVCGFGNNGGGGMVAARHLHNWGGQVSLKIIKKVNDLKPVPKKQLSILKALGIKFIESITNIEPEIILDAIIGYGIHGNPQGEAADWIEKINLRKIPIVSLDTPSGLNVTTGEPGNPCVVAKTTLTLALPKAGFLNKAAKQYFGELYLADIGVPNELLGRIGVESKNIFSEKSIIKVN